MTNGSSGRFATLMSSGLIGTAAWILVLVIYCVFRAFGIEDPLLGQAFLLLTGAWVGNLTLAQGKKRASVEETVEKVTQTVEKLKDVAKAEHPDLAGELE